MKSDWRCLVVIAVALVLGAILLAPLADARGGGGARVGGFGGGMGGRSFAGAGARGFEHGGVFNDRGVAWHDNDLARWHGHWNYWGGGGVPLYGSGYPAAYPVYVPANYGGNQGACYQACVSSGQYSPAQCGQMCYTA